MEQKINTHKEIASPTGAPKTKGFRFQPIYAAIIIALVVAVAGGAYIFANNVSAQTVTAGDNVSVYYTGTFANGTVFSTNVGKSPINFTVGAGQMIKGFDQAVIGMKVGQTKNVTVPPAEAYGAVNQSLFVSIGRSHFSNLTLSIGMQVENTNKQIGTITAFNATNVTVDFNPPLAGKSLNFEIQVVSINK